MVRVYVCLLLICLLILNLGISTAKAEEVLGWEDCVKEAAKNHPDLIAAQAGIKQSQASKAITAGTLFPQINSSLSASTSRTEGASGASAGDSYSYGLSGSQLIFDGTKTINDVRVAGQNVEASKQNFRFTSATVRFRLRSAFIALLKAQEAIRISQEIYNIRKTNLELISLRYKSGLEHRGALLTAEADVSQAEYDIHQAERDIEVAQQQLTKEMGRPQLERMFVRGDFQTAAMPAQKPDFMLIAKNNPSLDQLIAQRNAAGYGVKSAYANFAPTLTGNAGANKSGSRWSPDGDQWNLGLTLSMPIFEGGLKFAQLSQAKAQLKQLQENERSTRDSVILVLEQTWAGFQDALENESVQKKILAAAQERSRIAQAQYSTGFIVFDNWTIIEDNLVKAKGAYLDAQANALLAQASWIQAKGETLEYEE